MNEEKDNTPDRIWIDWDEREFHLKPLAGYVEYVRADLLTKRNAENAGMDIIREQDYADRDACLSKMAAAITLAIEFDGSRCYYSEREK